MRWMCVVALWVVMVVGGGAWGAAADAVPGVQDGAVQDGGVIEIRSLLVLGRVGSSGRSAVYTDAVEHAMVMGTWETPSEGDEVVGPGGGAQSWRRIEAGEDGGFRDRALAGGWGVAVVESDRERVMLLEARGHRFVHVNGEARVGDVYDLGNTVVAVRLRAGENTLLFKGGRGGLRARLVTPPREVMLDGRDLTLPDAIRGEDEDVWAGVLVMNAGEGWREGLVVRASVGGEVVQTPVAAIVPLGSFKAGVRIPGAGIAAAIGATDGAADGAERVAVRLELVDAGGAVLDARTVELRVRGANEKHVRTFVSGIDGSVQYYGVTPPPAEAGAGSGGDGARAMILTLHGASVEGSGQAAAYGQKEWAWIVAPTNRRPYGFDWEDWGRMDAMEVLDLASVRFGTDPARTYLTGHSMGGHGTWILGAQMAPRFAAIAPSAGWRDFWSYAARAEATPTDDVGRVLWRAANVSRTLLMEPNYAGLGVYVLHGDADDNVPVEQARFMRERLGSFHANFAYYERAGAGHWWGNQCVDWPPLMEFLQRNRREELGRERSIDFVTVDPGISASSGWATIEGQVVAREASRVRVRDARPGGAIDVSTENVSRLALALPSRDAGDGDESGAGTRVVIDGQALEWTGDPGAGTLRLARDGEAWRIAAPFNPDWKGPARSGAFKEAFGHRVLLVVGTRGTPEENAWALAKARYDAETFWYRGNGAMQIVTDQMLLAAFDGGDEAAGGIADIDRSVVLYGHRAMNAAWDRLLVDCPVVVERGRVAVGGREAVGGDLACLFVRPRPGSGVASVGVVAGTGAGGLRLAEQLPYFVSGAHYPDWTIIDSSMLMDAGDGRAGVVGCGFFAEDWGVGSDAAWREAR